MELDSLRGSRIGSDAARVALIERDRPWKIAAQALGGARAGRGSAVLIEGPSGLGKSALLSAVGELASESGIQTLEARGRSRETDFGFGVVVQLFESTDSERVFGSGSFEGLAEPSFQVLQSIYAFCVGLAGRAPLALLVDDADLADEPTLRFLLYLVERLHQLPIALVMAAETAGPNAPALLSDMSRHPLMNRCRLRPLTEAGTARRVTKCWLPGVMDSVVERIHALSGGNPLLVDAIAAKLAGTDAEALAQIVPDLAPLPVAEWALARAERLDARAPGLLSAVAVLGPKCEFRHAAALANLDGEYAAELVDGLSELGILTTADQLAFTQPVVAAAVEKAQPPGDRAARNLRAARLLADEDAPAEHVAGLLLQGARTGSMWAVDTLCTAAAVALGGGAPATAVRYLRRALEEPPSPAKRAHVILELGRAEAMAGEPQAAARLGDAADHLSHGPEQADAALATGRALFALGRPQQALAVFERGLDRAGELEDQVRVGRLRAGHATAVWLIGFPEGGVLPASPPPSAATAGDRALLALHAVEGAIRGVPYLDVRALAERALARGKLLEDETTDGLSYYLAAGALAFAEDLQTAEAALTAGIDDAQSRGSVLGFATASHARAVAIMMRGRLLDAEADARNALAVERHGWRLGLGGARVVLANSMIERGNLDEARRHIGDAEATAGEGDPFRMSLLSVRGRLQLVSGEVEAALSDFLAAGEIAERAGATNPAVAPWRASAGRAWAAAGDWAEAERLIQSELALATSFGAPGAIGRALRALASISEPGPALEALEAAVEKLAGSQLALERAGALVEFGAALRRSGRRRDARGPLSEGLELANRCGADVLAARALSETRAAGARPRRTALHGLGALTARERQAVLLAADGLSNREIAERLVVTLKTVEWHLNKGYRKLGVSSRTQLRKVLDDEASTSAS